MFDNELLVLKVQRIYSKILHVIAAFAMAGVALMSLSTTFDVLKRWFTGWPIGGVMQLNECLMVVLVFLGIPIAQYYRRHIRIAFVVSRLKPTSIVLSDMISCILGVICLLLLGIMTTKEAIYSFSISEYRVGDVRLPIYWAKALIPLGAFATLGQLLLNIWKDVNKLTGALPKKLRISARLTPNPKGNNETRMSKGILKYV